MIDTNIYFCSNVSGVPTISKVGNLLKLASISECLSIPGFLEDKDLILEANKVYVFNADEFDLIEADEYLGDLILKCKREISRICLAATSRFMDENNNHILVTEGKIYKIGWVSLTETLDHDYLKELINSYITDSPNFIELVYDAFEVDICSEEGGFIEKVPYADLKYYGSISNSSADSSLEEHLYVTIYDSSLTPIATKSAIFHKTIKDGVVTYENKDEIVFSPEEIMW